jgi:hypothetical protein
VWELASTISSPFPPSTERISTIFVITSHASGFANPRIKDWITALTLSMMAVKYFSARDMLTFNLKTVQAHKS